MKRGCKPKRLEAQKPLKKKKKTSPKAYEKRKKKKKRNPDQKIGEEPT